MQGACQTSGQAVQARSSAEALQAAHHQVQLHSASQRPSSSDARDGTVPKAMQRQIAAGRRVLFALVALNVSRLKDDNHED